MAPEDEAVGRAGALDGVERRRNLWLLGLAVSPFPAAVLLMVASSLLPLGAGAVCFMLLMLGIALAHFTWRRNPFPRRVPVQLEAGGEVLTIRDGATQRSIEVAKMLRGVRTAGSFCQVVRITRRWGTDLTFELANAEADALLTRLGLDVRQRTASFRGMSRMHAGAWTMGAAASIAGLSSAALLFAALSTTPGLLALIPVVMLIPLVLALVPSQIDVGADGVSIRWLGTRRFVGYANLAGVGGIDRPNSHLTIVTLATHEGTTVQIPIAGRGQWYTDADELCARIFDARNAWKAGNARAPMPLLRGQRDHRQWVSALRRQDAADLRSSALPRAELWRVIEDPSGAPVERAAAALALGRELGDVDRARLAQVANATAAPKLRVVLERAERAEDEELARQLRVLEQTRG